MVHAVASASRSAAAPAVTTPRRPSVRPRPAVGALLSLICFPEQLIVLPYIYVVRLQLQSPFVLLIRLVELPHLLVSHGQVVPGAGALGVELDGLGPPVDRFLPEPELSHFDTEGDLLLGLIDSFLQGLLGQGGRSPGEQNRKERESRCERIFRRGQDYLSSVNATNEVSITIVMAAARVW